jgi:hypothetical protein
MEDKYVPRLDDYQPIKREPDGKVGEEKENETNV